MSDEVPVLEPMTSLEEAIYATQFIVEYRFAVKVMQEHDERARRLGFTPEDEDGMRATAARRAIVHAAQAVIDHRRARSE